MSPTMSNDTLDHKALRKAWLKQTFGSFKYHEEMLALHAQWVTHIKKALDRAEQDNAAQQPMAWLRTKAVPIFDKAAKPGKLDPAKWEPGKQAGWARDILDYDRDTGLDQTDTWMWMTEAERKRLYELWGPMSRMARNIQYTVDDRWDDDPPDCDWILDEKYTGPITWPTTFAATQAARIKAGEPVPQAGLWQALDASVHRQRVNVSDKLPDLGSAYGITIWQWVAD
jgi:hypothetical protein